VPEAAELLRVMGCDEGQGYLFARPLELEAFDHFYREAIEGSVVSVA
jgi:EAL domain-containing protein (putative c-di-GMP-specific phosphodiesterase class I)